MPSARATARRKVGAHLGELPAGLPLISSVISARARLGRWWGAGDGHGCILHGIESSGNNHEQCS
jgi:hypothetical protein